jgi:hypothetical protein
VIHTAPPQWREKVIVTIDLLDRPRHGRTQILVRCQLSDKVLVERVAGAIGMTLADFVRTTVIKSARAIEKELADGSEEEDKDC